MLSERFNIRLEPDDAVALRVAAELENTEPTAVARAAVQASVRTVATINDRGIGKLNEELGELRQERDIAKARVGLLPQRERAEATAAAKKLADQVVAKEDALVKALVAVLKARQEQETDRLRKLGIDIPQRHAALLARGQAAFAEIRAVHGGLVGLYAEAAAVPGLRDRCCPHGHPDAVLWWVANGTLEQSAQQLQPAADAHKNGRSRVKIISLADANILGRKMKKFQALAAEHPEDVEFTKDANGRWPNIGEMRYYVSDIARGLIELRLAEPAPEIDDVPATPSELESVRLLVQIPPNNKGETIWVTSERAAEYAAKRWAEPIDASAAVPTTVSEGPRVRVKVLAGFRVYAKGDVTSIPRAEFDRLAPFGFVEPLDSTPIPSLPATARHARSLAGLEWDQVRGGGAALRATQAFGLWHQGEVLYVGDDAVREALLEAGVVELAEPPAAPAEEG